MNHDWTVITELFHRLEELPLSERKAELVKIKNTRPKIYQELEQLFDYSGENSEFLETPLWNISPIQEFAVGERIGDWTLIEKIGAGSSGVVYLAYEHGLDRKVALKLTTRFSQEAKLMAPLDHPNFVKVFSRSILVAHSVEAICMQYIEGASLQVLLERDPEKYLTLPWILNLGDKITSALSHAHESNVLHLDIKPSNILIDKNENIFLMDFSVSSTARDGKALGVHGGTYEYMSPEHRLSLESLEPVQVTHLADVYSVGKLLEKLASRIAPMEPAPKKLKKTLTECIENDPNLRPESAKKIQTALKDCSDYLSITEKLKKTNPWAGFVRRHWFSCLLLGFVFPHILGTAINIPYNWLMIVSYLSKPSQEFFYNLCFYYNSVIYPVCLTTAFIHLAPIVRALKTDELPPQKKEALRARVLKLPNLILALSTFGWLPGGIIFPACLSVALGEKLFPMLYHFMLSFTLSWLVAMVFSFYYASVLTIGLMYSPFLDVVPQPKEKARQELGPLVKSFFRLAPLVWLTPLVGVFLMIWLNWGDSLSYPFLYKSLLSFLVVLGVFGIWGWNISLDHFKKNIRCYR